MKRMTLVLLALGTVLMLGGGYLAFIGTGGWKLLGSRFEDETSVAATVRDIEVANPGLAQIEIRSANGREVRFHRTVRYLSPFTARPGQTHRIDGTTLFLDQCDGLCAIDYIVYVPDGVRVARSAAEGRAMEMTSRMALVLLVAGIVLLAGAAAPSFISAGGLKLLGAR